MNTPICPICEEELVMEQAVNLIGGNDESLEDVWVCKNKKCSGYDETVYDEGDMEEMEGDL